jgi:hypothetical protein
VGNVAEAQELFDQQLRLLELMLECLKVPVKSDALMFAHRLAGDQWEMIEWHLLEGTYINAEELVDREVPLQGTKYVHDCNKCIPLGPFKDHAGVVDLYWCSNAVMPTVTVRYSSGPHEEFSGGINMATGTSAVQEAWHRAELLGFPLQPYTESASGASAEQEA